MGMILHTNGLAEMRQPSNGVHWTVTELQEIIGTSTIDIVSTIDGRFLVTDDLGKINQRPLNKAATRLYIHGRSDVIVGAAVVVDTMLELDGPEEDDENDEAL